MLSPTKGTKSSLLIASKQTDKICCDDDQFLPEQLVLPLVFGIQEGKKLGKLELPRIILKEGMLHLIPCSPAPIAAEDF